MDIRTAIDIVEDTAARLRLRPGANAAARGNYAALVCVMNPKDFIRLTTHGQVEYDKIFSDEFSPASEFNSGTGTYNFNGYYAPFLDVDAATGRVTGHEGRHRAAMIAQSGGDKFPVMIKLYQGESYYIIGKKVYVDGPDDEPFEIEMPSYEEAEATLEKMKIEGDNLDNDWWYSGLRIKTNYSFVHKGSPAHRDPDSFKKKPFAVSDMPQALVGQFEPSVVVPTSQMRFGPVKGYRHFREDAAPQVETAFDRWFSGSEIGNKGTFDPNKKNIDEDVATAPVADTDTVRLYHGTNTALAADIERYGLQATGGEGAYSHLRGLARDVLDEIPPALDRELRRMASYYRTPSIFLTPNLAVAKNHAQINPNGGEVGQEVVDAIREIVGVNVDLFADAKPCVVAVDVPRSWLKKDINPNQYEVVLHRPEIGPEHIAGIEVL